MALLSTSLLERAALLSVFRAARPPCTLICAPSGYGKSVLAAQLAQYGGSDSVLWVSLDDCSDNPVEVTHRVCSAAGVPDRGSAEAALALQAASDTDWLLSLRHWLMGTPGTTWCLVLDGLGVLGSLDLINPVLETFLDVAEPGSCAIATCRQLDDQDARFITGQYWFVGTSDLRFTRTEASLLAGGWTHSTFDADVSERIMDQSGGQPALFSILLRHPALSNADGMACPRDLIWYLDATLARLSQRSLHALYAASLLRNGELRDLRTVVDFRTHEWHELSDQIPLFRVEREGQSTAGTFRVHALLAAETRRLIRRCALSDKVINLRRRALERLYQDGRHSQLVEVLTEEGEEGEKALWLSRDCHALLRGAGTSAVRRCLESLPPAMLANTPSLLLQLAATLREGDTSERAVQTSRLALSLAENSGDHANALAARLMLARLGLDRGQSELTIESIFEMPESQRQSATATQRVLADSYLAVATCQADGPQIALPLLKRLEESLQELREPVVEAYVRNCIAAISGPYMGNWPAALSALMAAPGSSEVLPSQRLVRDANEAAVLLELGRLTSARPLAESVIASARACGLGSVEASALGTLSGILATEGKWTEAEICHNSVMQLLDVFPDAVCKVMELSQWAMLTRSVGRLDESRLAAERALCVARALRGGARTEVLQAECELAATLVAQGRVQSGRERAERVKSDASASGAWHHAAKCALTLAAAELQLGCAGQARSAIEESAAYLGSEAAAWVSDMYCRAFPGLSGVLGQSIGGRLSDCGLATGDARYTGAPDDPDSSECLHGSTSRELRGHALQPDVMTTCYVRLLGGLEVHAPWGVITEDAWRKRKARALFIMLAVAGGRDIPRDSILERLWPDMDEPKARSNFYVTWSAMKRALDGPSQRGASQVMVRNVGGLCRVTASVRTDLQEFLETVDHARRVDSKEHGDELLRGARRLVDLYRADLLPGDVYDDWLEQLRVRLRMDYCDVLVRAAAAYEAVGAWDDALVLLGKISEVDAWREDVYQALMRCHARAGRRSLAIQAYMNCRARLVEDLGIDPSVETRRLYESVISLDPPAATDFAGV